MKTAKWVNDPDIYQNPFFEKKFDDYITNVLPQITDTICVEIDKILKIVHTNTNDEIFRFVMSTINNYFAKQMMMVPIHKDVVPENVWIHLAEKWQIPFAKWNSDDYIEILKREVSRRSPALVGKKAPQIERLMVLPNEHFKAAALDTAIKFDIHAGIEVKDFSKELLKSKFTVLFFWDIKCDACLKSIQELFELWEESKDYGLQIITIQMYNFEGKEKGTWIDFVNENNMFGDGWFNAWSPYNNNFRQLYNIINVPTIYLLDENGVILFRNIRIENLKEIIKRM